MTGFRVLVVDDEPLARAAVALLLTRDAEVASVVECGDPRQVPGLIELHRPHLAILDIEMPEIDGISLAANIGAEGPVVVFLTAYRQHATRAFDVAAVDYVLKPFSDARLGEAIERAKRRLRERRLGELAHEVASLSAELHAESEAKARATVPQPFLERFTFKTDDRVVVVKSADVVWIEAEDYYVRVHTTRGRHLARTALAELERRMDPRQFARVHRGALVNLDEVREFERDGTWLRLSDGARVAVSRARRKHLGELLSPRLR